MPNILITSAGRRVSLVKYFQSELRALIGLESKVYTTDLEPTMSSACIISDGAFKVGYFADENYMPYLKQICIENNISIIVPTLDPELEILAKHKADFLESGIHILVSDYPLIKICRDKRNMNKFFIQKGFEIPKAIEKTNPSFPVFIKPIDGSSSKDLHLITHPDQLSKDLVQRDNLIWMEYLPKEEFDEFTVDMYYNKDSKLKCIVPRVRLAVRGGETNKGITNKDKFLIEYISSRLQKIEGAKGCLTLQVFKSKLTNKVYGIEINPRFGGGYPLSYLAKANFPKWIIQEYLLDEEIQEFSDWDNNKLLLRYDFEFTVDNFES